jgi:hypothetical protein
MKELKLTKKHYALIDDADFERVSAWRWKALISGATVYAVRSTRQGNILLHRFLLGLPSGHSPEVDHRDSNGLNCQRRNLRVATPSQNQAAKRKTKRLTSSAYKGVCWDKQHRKWKVQLESKGKHINVGLFDDEVLAARAYDASALMYHGDFAYLNFKEVS